MLEEGRSVGTRGFSKLGSCSLLGCSMEVKNLSSRFFDVHGRKSSAELRCWINIIPFREAQYSPEVVEKNCEITQKRVVGDLGLVVRVLPHHNARRGKIVRIFLNSKNAIPGDPIIFFHDFNIIPNFLY